MIFVLLVKCSTTACNQAKVWESCLKQNISIQGWGGIKLLVSSKNNGVHNNSELILEQSFLPMGDCNLALEGKELAQGLREAKTVLSYKSFNFFSNLSLKNKQTQKPGHLYNLMAKGKKKTNNNYPNIISVFQVAW